MATRRESIRNEIDPDHIVCPASLIVADIRPSPNPADALPCWPGRDIRQRVLIAGDSVTSTRPVQ
jgi:hypothetical protein